MGREGGWVYFEGGGGAFRRVALLLLDGLLRPFCHDVYGIVGMDW